MTWEFGQANVLEPHAIGEPGKRTFRVQVISGRRAAALWLEKEQLGALVLAIRQLLEQTSGEDQSDERGSSPPGGSFPAQPDVDFKVGKIGIGYDDARHMVAIYAYEVNEAEDAGGGAENGDDAPPTFSFQASRDQCRAFADQAEEVISAGRPLCLVCGAPIDADGHACQRRNGHTQRPVSFQ